MGIFRPDASFEVFTAVTIQFMVFWEEDGGSTVLLNDGVQPPRHTARVII
jgi:hypothetical protein